MPITSKHKADKRNYCDNNIINLKQIKEAHNIQAKAIREKDTFSVFLVIKQTRTKGYPPWPGRKYGPIWS